LLHGLGWLSTLRCMAPEGRAEERKTPQGALRLHFVDVSQRVVGIEFRRFAGEQEPHLHRPTSARLESQVCSQLQDTRVIRAGNLTERGADVLGIVVEVVKFSMVEDVEGIDAKFEGDSFAIEWRRLCQ
jgi:hypothetical protein